MNGETGFWHSFGVWLVAVCRSGIRGELAMGGIFVPHTCMR